ncbi:protein FAM193B isoform X1 [Hypanus sabinus]|uniref:protein FAM193B isoform X1 n=1 Tax=Hypanus sabinus TaxID=79690 RepID=UPI0028C39705|nr:protein FAM193B isoform X1 [Hypanus sabinus]
MNCAEEKRVAGRRKKNKRGSGSNGSASAVAGESRSPSPAEGTPSPAHGEQPESGTGTGPGAAREQASLTVHQLAKDCCLLCHHERKEWGTQQNGIVDLKKLANSMPALTHGLLEHMPLWICQTCQRRVEEEEQRAIIEQALMVKVGQSECQAHKEMTDESVRTLMEGDGVSILHRLPTEKCHHSAIHCCHQLHRQTLASSASHPQQLQSCATTPNGIHTKESNRITSDCSRSPSCVSAKNSSVQCKNMSRRPPPPGGEFHCTEDHRYSVLAAPPNSPTGLSSHQHPLTAPKSPEVANESAVTIQQHGHPTSTTQCTVPHSTVSSSNSNRKTPVASGIPQVLPHVHKTSAVSLTNNLSPDVSLISKNSVAASTGVLVTPVPPSANSHIPNNGLFPKTTAAAPICTSHYNGACPVTTTPNPAASSSGICRDQSCKSRLCTNETAYSPTRMHNADESLEEDDSCSEHSSCTSHSANQKEGKYCDCCYCEFFGHGPPPAAPTSRNYTEIREKLRTRLTKRKEELPQKASNGSIREPPVDERNVEDLLNYINSSEQKPANSTKAAKRARHKQKKQEKARSELFDQRLERPCPSSMHIQDLENVSVINQHLQEGIEEKVLIFNQHVQDNIEEKVSKLNQHLQDDIEEKLNQRELWHQVELQRVSSILTSRLEQLKDRIRDSIKANFNISDLPRDDFSELPPIGKGFLIDNNSTMDKEEAKIIDHQKLNLNLSLTTMPGIVQNHLLTGNKHTVIADQDNSGSNMLVLENSLGKKSTGNTPLSSKVENTSASELEDDVAVVVHKSSSEQKVIDQVSKSGKQPRQSKQQISEVTKSKSVLSRKEQEQPPIPKVQGSKQSTAKHKANQNHDGKSADAVKTMIAKCEEPRQGKVKGVCVLSNSEAGEVRKCNTKNSNTEKLEGPELKGVKEEQQALSEMSQSKGKNRKGKKKKHDKTNNSVVQRTAECTEKQDGVQASSGVARPKQSDDVFLPKDIDLDSVEMDETDREVEHFKRFCLDSAKQTRPKVSVNWSNFSLKKGPNTAH